MANEAKTTSTGKTRAAALAAARRYFDEREDSQYVIQSLLESGYIKDNSDECYDEGQELYDAVEQEYIDKYEKESDEIFPL